MRHRAIDAARSIACRRASNNQRCICLQSRRRATLGPLTAEVRSSQPPSRTGGEGGTPRAATAKLGVVVIYLSMPRCQREDRRRRPLFSTVPAAQRAMCRDGQATGPMCGRRVKRLAERAGLPDRPPQPIDLTLIVPRRESAFVATLCGDLVADFPAGQLLVMAGSGLRKDVSPRSRSYFLACNACRWKN